MRLPRGVREQPGWIFIGLMVMLTGLSYSFGISTSRIADLIGTKGLQSWGAFLTVTGMLVTYATWSAKPSLEKMSLRWMTFSLLAYVSWLCTLVNVSQAAMTFMLSAILIVLSEIRVAYINILLDAAQRLEGGTADAER